MTFIVCDYFAVFGFVPRHLYLPMCGLNEVNVMDSKQECLHFIALHCVVYFRLVTWSRSARQ